MDSSRLSGNAEEARSEEGRNFQNSQLTLPRNALLKDRAYETLKELILSESIPSGSFLSERQLVAQLGGMSKTPIRVALERLQMEGLVSVSPQQGILVREVSLREIVDMFDLRDALETFVVARIAGRLTSEQRAGIEENLTQAEASVQAEDEVEYARLDAAFHLLLCEFLDNREIVWVMQRNRDKLSRVILRVMRRDKGRLVTSHADHVSIVEAVNAGDGVLAAARVRDHLEYGKHILLG